MATTDISLKYRPLRIGFLIQKGNIADLVKVARLNTLLWGGIFNPIIPVSEESKSAQQLIDYFAVDTLIPVSHTPEIEKILASNIFLRPPNVHEHTIFHEDWRGKKNDLYYLDSLNIIDFYWGKYYRDKPKEFKSNCGIIRWQNDDALANIFALQFGHYPAQAEYNLLYDFDRSFVSGLRACESVIPKDGLLIPELAKYVTPILLTDSELVSYSNQQPHGNAGIYIGDENNFSDLVSFWNLRAEGYHPMFLPKAHVERFRPLIEARLKKLDAQPSREPFRFDHNIPVYFLSVPQVEVDTIVRSFTSKKGFMYSQIRPELEEYSLRDALPHHHFERQTVLASVDESHGKPVVSFSLPDKKFLADDSGVGDKDVDWQNLVVSLDFRSEFEYSGHTFKLPFIRALNEFYSREIVFDPWRLRVEEEGIGIIEQCSATSVHVYPIPHQSLVERVFKFTGITAKRSQAGLLASQIIESMHERSPLEACRVFKIRGVRKLLNTLKPDDLIGWNGALKTIGKENFGKFKTLYIESREKDELEPSDVLTFLLKKKILTPRLRRWERIMRCKRLFKCKKCGLGSDIRMSAFEGVWRCLYCEHEQYLPQFIGMEFRDKKMWRLKKRGLFGKDNHQEGAMPVITSLMVFLRILERGGFIYSTALNLKAERPCETDLCIFQYDQGKAIEVGIGECKSDGGRIVAGDISNLKEIRQKLNVAGLRCFLIFAKTADSFDVSEIALFSKLRDEHIPFVLLTNKELEPYHPYWEKGDEKLPSPHPFKLEELAWNSEAIYLPTRATITTTT